MTDKLAVREVSPELTARGYDRDYLEDLFHMIPDQSVAERIGVMLVASTADQVAYELQCRICAQYADDRELAAFIRQCNERAAAEGLRSIHYQTALEMAGIGRRLEEAGKRMAVDYPHVTRTYFQTALEAGDRFTEVLNQAEKLLADPDGKLTTRQFKALVHPPEEPDEDEGGEDDPTPSKVTKTATAKSGRTEKIDTGEDDPEEWEQYPWGLELRTVTGDTFMVLVKFEPEPGATEPELDTVDIAGNPGLLVPSMTVFQFGVYLYQLDPAEPITIPDTGEVLEVPVAPVQAVPLGEVIEGEVEEAGQQTFRLEAGSVVMEFPEVAEGEGQPLWKWLKLRGPADVRVPAGFIGFDEATGQVYRTGEDITLDGTGRAKVNVERLAVMASAVPEPVQTTLPSTEPGHAPEPTQRTDVITVGYTAKIQVGSPVSVTDPLYFDAEDGMFYGTAGEGRVFVGDRVQLKSDAEQGGIIVEADILGDSVQGSAESIDDDGADLERWTNQDGTLMKNCYDCDSCRAFGEGRKNHLIIGLLNEKGTETVAERDRGAVSWWCTNSHLSKRIISVRTQVLRRAVSMARGCPHFNRSEDAVQLERADADAERVPVQPGSGSLLDQLEGDDE